MFYFFLNTKFNFYYIVTFCGHEPLLEKTVMPKEWTNYRNYSPFRPSPRSPLGILVLCSDCHLECGKFASPSFTFWNYCNLTYGRCQQASILKQKALSMGRCCSWHLLEPRDGFFQCQPCPLPVEQSKTIFPPFGVFNNSSLLQAGISGHPWKAPNRCTYVVCICLRTLAFTVPSLSWGAVW